MPCHHVIAIFAHVRIDHMLYVSPIYKLQNVFNVYNHSLGYFLMNHYGQKIPKMNVVIIQTTEEIPMVVHK